MGSCWTHVFGDSYLSPLGALPYCSPKRLPVSAPPQHVGVALAVPWSVRPLLLSELLTVAVMGGVSGSSLYVMCLLTICICSWKEMATHSSILAWKIPWTEEPVGYSPWGHKQSDMTEPLHFHFEEKFIQTVCPFYVWVVRVLSVFWYKSLMK